MRKIISGSLTLGLLLALAGCGGGGGGGGASGTGGGNAPGVTGNIAAPTSGPGDVQRYFPLDAGNHWNYNLAGPSPASGAVVVYGLATASVNTATVTVGGVNATVVNFADTVGDAPSSDDFTSTGGGLTVVASNDPGNPIQSQILPVAVLTFPPLPGPVSSVTATAIDWGQDLNNSGHHATTSFTQSISVAGSETVTVPAGVFPAAVKTVETISGSVLPYGASQALAYSGSETQWYAPGVGVVRSTTSVSVAGVSTGGGQDLRGYTVAGVDHGFATPVTVTTPGTTPDLSNQPHRSASDGNTLLSLIGPAAYLSTTSGQLLATLSWGNATPGAVAYDHTHYAVVSLGPVPSNPSTAAFFLTRVNAAGGVLDAAPGVQLGLTPTNVLAGLAAGSGTSGLLLYSDQGVLTGPGVTQVTANLYAVVIDLESGAVLSTPVLVSANYQGNYNVAVASDGSNWLLTWTESSTVGSTVVNQLFARRVSAAGALMESAALPLSPQVPTLNNPQVAFDGTNYLVVWPQYLSGQASAGTTTTILWATRISPAGAVLDGMAGAGALQLSSSAAHFRNFPALAWNGTEYLVLWGDTGGATWPAGTYGVRLSPAGTFNSGPGYEIPVLVGNQTFAQDVVRVTAVGPGHAQVSWASSAFGSMHVSPF